MRGDEIFVDSGIDRLVCAEAVIGSLKTPHSNLRNQSVVDLLDHVLVFDYELEGNDVAGSVNTFVGSSTSDEGGFLGVVGIVFGNGTGLNKCFEKVAFDGLVVVGAGSGLEQGESFQEWLSYNCIPR